MLSLSGQLPLKGLEEAKRAEEKTQSKEKGEGETNAGRPDLFCFFTSAPFGALDTDVRTLLELQNEHATQSLKTDGHLSGKLFPSVL